MKHAFAFAFGICVSLIPVHAHCAGSGQTDQEFLDSLAIPDFGALEKLFGKFVRLDQGSFTAIYKFAPDNTVEVVIGPPDIQRLAGTWRNDDGKTCIKIGGPDEFCGVIKAENGRVTFAGPNAKPVQGEVYDLEPPPLMAIRSVPLDTDMCEALTSMVDDEPYQFESLIDDSREQGQVGPLLAPFWYGKVGFWGDDCRVEKSAASEASVYNCQRVFDKTETDEASAFYLSNLQQIELCLAKRTKETDHDYAYKNELAKSMIGEGRATSIELEGGTNVLVSQGSTSVCRQSSYINCDQVYGVWLSVTADLLAERP